MPKESLGFVKLEWTCPKCGTRNPGPEKLCLSCGAPQPENVTFEQPAHQEIIQDEKEIREAKAGADIHCGFCGTRNPAGTKICSQCGADLEKGTRRESGKVIGAYSTAPVKTVDCPNCGTKNSETALKCANCGASLGHPEPLSEYAGSPGAPIKPRWGLPATIGVAGAVILCVAILATVLFMSLKTESMTGVVENANWTTMVAIQALQPVEHSGWLDEIPADAQVGACSLEVHHTQEEETQNSNKVCGTPYTVDKGSGFAEVVQDCVYEVMQDYCSYTTNEWRQVDVVKMNGSDSSPVWAQPQLAEGQRIGQQDQTFTIQFETPEGQLTYTLNDAELFQQLRPGSEWLLNINSFGSIVSIEPEN